MLNSSQIAITTKNFHLENDFALSHDSEIEALEFLRELSPQYPEIASWYTHKVLTGLRIGSRHLILEKRFGRIAAIGIAKNECGERKICTVRVAPEFQGIGLGPRIFDRLIEWTGTARPHATVSEENMGLYSKIFDKLGFELTSIRNGLYRSGKAEYFFNESVNLKQ